MSESKPTPQPGPDQPAPAKERFYKYDMNTNELTKSTPAAPAAGTEGAQEVIARALYNIDRQENSWGNDQWDDPDAVDKSDYLKHALWLMSALAPHLATPAPQTNKCPQCAEPLIMPCDAEPYCENCGWPDDNRAQDNEAVIDEIASNVLGVVSPEGHDTEEWAQVREAVASGYKTPAPQPDTDDEQLKLIDERDEAEAAADKLASLVLDEPIDWSDHQGKWQEAIEELESATIRAAIAKEGKA